MRAPNFYPGVPEAEYHADPAMSSTGLKRLLVSPAHFKAYLAEPPRDTPALVLGRALHCALLEPDSYAARYAVAPVCDRRTKDGKAAWADFEAAHPGATILKPEEAETVARMAEQLRAHPLAPLLFTQGRAELSGYWSDPETGAPCRLRFDYLREADQIGVDLKTTLDASPAAFARAIAKFGYHVQAAFYGRGFRAITGEPLQDFAFVVAEKSPPFAVAIYRIEDGAIQAGERKVAQGMRRFAECMERNEWPAYAADITPIGLPAWALDFDEEDAA